MKKTVLFSAAGALAVLAALPAGAQQLSARVISSTPVVQQVQVPRQICSNQPVAVQQPRSGAGTAIGAIEGNNVAQVQNVANCTTQVTLENRTVGYDVTYEIAGNQYSVQMPQDPGPTIRLQLSPVRSSTASGAEPYTSGAYPNGGMPIVNQVIVPSTVVYPTYYSRPYYYYPPVGVSLGIGYYRGYGYGRRGGAHHWR